MATTVKRMLVGLCIIGATAVMLGAFGSHSLKGLIDAPLIRTWSTGVQYQFYHLPLLLAAAILHSLTPTAYTRWAYRLAMAGILLFCGSLYLLATRYALGIESWTWLGPLTPIGGLCLVAAWLALLLGVMRVSYHRPPQ